MLWSSGSTLHRTLRSTGNGSNSVGSRGRLVNLYNPSCQLRIVAENRLLRRLLLSVLAHYLNRGASHANSRSVSPPVGTSKFHVQGSTIFALFPSSPPGFHLAFLHLAFLRCRIQSLHSILNKILPGGCFELTRRR